MPKSDVLRSRVEPELKAHAGRILDKLGLSHSDAIRLFYKQIVALRGLPFDMKLKPEDKAK